MRVECRDSEIIKNPTSRNVCFSQAEKLTEHGWLVVFFPIGRSHTTGKGLLLSPFFHILSFANIPYRERQRFSSPIICFNSVNQSSNIMMCFGVVSLLVVVVVVVVVVVIFCYNEISSTGLKTEVVKRGLMVLYHFCQGIVVCNDFE